MITENAFPRPAPSYADQLARARAHIEAALPLPLDLGAWLIKRLEEATAAEYLRLKRDQHLRRAGELIGGSCSARAKSILSYSAAVERTWRFYSTSSPDLGTVSGEIIAARSIMPLPNNRQLRSILGKQPGGRGLAVETLAIANASRPS